MSTTSADRSPEDDVDQLARLRRLVRTHYLGAHIGRGLIFAAVVVLWVLRMPAEVHTGDTLALSLTGFLGLLAVGVALWNFRPTPAVLQARQTLKEQS